jgi:hypothetical protein
MSASRHSALARPTGPPPLTGHAQHRSNADPEFASNTADPGSRGARRHDGRDLVNVSILQPPPHPYQMITFNRSTLSKKYCLYENHFASAGNGASTLGYWLLPTLA